MTKEKFIICAAIAFFGALLNFFSKTSKHAGIKNVLDFTIGVFLLLIILSSFKIGGTEINIRYNGFDYEKISTDVVDEAILKASEQIEEAISSDVCANFNLANVKSDVIISRESFEVEKAIIYISNSRVAVSNYHIKIYLKQKYDMDVEVLIC